MLNKIIVLILLTTCLVACNTQQAFKYSEAFVAKEKSILPYIEMSEKNIERLITAEQFDSVTLVAQQMENRVALLIDSIKIAPAPDATDGEKFKVDVIKYFEYIKSVYTIYKNYGSAGNDELRNVQVDKLTALVNRRDEITTTIQKAQRSFAKANGFTIEK